MYFFVWCFFVYFALSLFLINFWCSGFENFENSLGKIQNQRKRSFLDGPHHAVDHEPVNHGFVVLLQGVHLTKQLQHFVVLIVADYHETLLIQWFLWSTGVCLKIGYPNKNLAMNFEHSKNIGLWHMGPMFSQPRGGNPEMLLVSFGNLQPPGQSFTQNVSSFRWLAGKSTIEFDDFPQRVGGILRSHVSLRTVLATELVVSMKEKPVSW